MMVRELEIPSIAPVMTEPTARVPMKAEMAGIADENAVDDADQRGDDETAEHRLRRVDRIGISDERIGREIAAERRHRGDRKIRTGPITRQTVRPSEIMPQNRNLVHDVEDIAERREYVGARCRKIRFSKNDQRDDRSIAATARRRHPTSSPWARSWPFASSVIFASDGQIA